MNPILNAVVDERFNLALEEARQVDVLLASGQKSVEEIERDTPLFGVPLTVKESVSVKGNLPISVTLYIRPVDFQVGKNG